MSIDAKIETVCVRPDGSGYLLLADRPARPGGSPGCAGQRRLRFDASPRGVGELAGHEVWGGANSIMLGDAVIADRVGYTAVVFRHEEAVAAALAKVAEQVAENGRRRAPAS